MATTSQSNGITTSWPSDTVMTSTPSAMASSMEAMILYASQKGLQTLYVDILAEGTPRLAMPSPIPKKLTRFTAFPAAIKAVWVPWPMESLVEGTPINP